MKFREIWILLPHSIHYPAHDEDQQYAMGISYIQQATHAWLINKVNSSVIELIPMTMHGILVYGSRKVNMQLLKGLYMAQVWRECLRRFNPSCPCRVGKIEDSKTRLPSVQLGSTGQVQASELYPKRLCNQATRHASQMFGVRYIPVNCKTYEWTLSEMILMYMQPCLAL